MGGSVHKFGLAVIAAMTAVISSAASLAAAGAAETVLVEQGKPRCRIVISRKSPAVHRNIAQVLMRRVAKRTGCQLPIVDHEDDQQQAPGETVVVIGGPSTSPLVEPLCRQAGVLSPTQANVGPAGFVVCSLVREGKSWIVLSGSDDLGTVCAVGKFLRSIDFADHGATVGPLRIVERIDPTKRKGR